MSLLTSERFLERMRRFDAHPKTLADFRRQTRVGACVTVAACALMAALLVAELRDLLRMRTTEHLLVDVSRSDKLRVHLGVTFSRLACAALAVDAVDVSGDQQTNIALDLRKQRLDLKGVPLAEPAER